MAASSLSSAVGAVNHRVAAATPAAPARHASAFFGTSLKKQMAAGKVVSSSAPLIRAMASDKPVDEELQTSKDRWGHLGTDMSDDQQDITRGKGMVDSLFQAPMGDGTHHAVLSSYEYISQGLREYGLDNKMDGFYIAPAFMDKLVVHIAKNFMELPNIKLPGMYNKQENARVPIVVTGNDFSTLYAPLIRDGRMEKFYWAPTREDRVGVCTGIFRADNVPEQEIVKLVDTFPGQSIDFFGALRARVYDDEVRRWVTEIGVDSIGKKLVNSRDGPPKFDQPKMTLQKLLEYGSMLVKEQENVKRVQLADKYMSEAALGDANADAIATGKFY
uniref:Chloroplast rubisco activase 2 n=1 Tax=Sagittaria graminea TaxID=146149 RepID=R4L6S4_9LILI|nr:chloroplast rubisco activase 2 [Sagittaria graminea]AGL08675.1 chloroplast rubisco activase 2 [Sagittaria graminea]